MLRASDNQIYYEDDKVQAIPLRVKTSGGMYIILLKDGDAAALLSSMTSEYFDEIRNDSIYTTGKLLLQRFLISTDAIELKDVPVWLSSALHKVVIEVDEKGTTTATITVMSVQL